MSGVKVNRFMENKVDITINNDTVYGIEDKDAKQIVLQGACVLGVDEDLYQAIKHGSHEHKVWLRRAIKDFFSGQPIEPARQ